MGLVRFMLALAVLLSHLPLASYKFLSGGLAVQSFFIVSGFYMALVLDGKYRDARLFYSNRLLRLFPTYFVMLALSAVALWGFNANPVSTTELFALVFADPVRAFVMGFENLAILGQEMLFWFSIDQSGAFVFDSSGPLPDEDTTVGWQALLVPQAWSISMELMFYALAPFLARLHWRWIAGLALASIGLRLAGHLMPVDYLLWQGRFFPTALFLFLLGMLAHKALPFAVRLPKSVGWAVCALLVAMIATFPLYNLPQLESRWLVYAIVAIATPFIFAASRSVALDRWIGDLSYPIYLSQLLVIGAVLVYEPPFGLWIGILGTIALSVVLMLLVDMPVDRWRQRRAAKSGAPAPPEAGVAPL